MATIQYDSEFMTNMVAGNPIPPVATPENVGIPGNPKKQFAVIKDEQQQPMVVHLTAEACPKLMIIYHDKKDVLQMLDLGQACGAPSNAIIQAFDIVQDDSLKLYLSFAYFRIDNHSQNTSHLEVFYPFWPRQVCEYQGGRRLVGGLYYDDPKVAPIEQIIMTPGNSKNPHPSILLLHKIKEPTQPWYETMTPIWVYFISAGWKWDKMENIFSQRKDKILQILPSTGGSWHGWYVLCEDKWGDRAIRSAFFDRNSASTVSPRAQEQVFWLQGNKKTTSTAIGILLDGEYAWGQTLVLSDKFGLHVLEYSDLKLQSTCITEDENLVKCRSLQSTHHENGEINIWFRSSSNKVGYIHVKGNTFRDIVRDKAIIPPPTLLLPAGDSVYAEPLALGKCKGHNWQSIIIADNNGSLTHLQQASDTGHWHQKPFYIHHHEGLHEVDSYTITIRPLQEDLSPLISGWVQIRSSSAVTGYLNGRNATLSPNPQWYETDFEGILNFIIPTTSMACPTLTVTELKSYADTQIHVKPTVIDPSKKVANQLDQTFDRIGSWEGLKDLKTQSGKHMLDHNAMPRDSELKDSFSHLKTLHDAHKKLSLHGDTTTFYAADGSFIPPPESIFDSISDAWHYVTRAVHEAEDWAVKAAGDVFKFVAKIGEKVFEFILDTAEKVMHAATWIWNKLKSTIKNLIELVGYIFDWNSICNTKDTISALITSSIGLLAKKAGGAGDSLIDKLDGTTKHLRNNPNPSEVHANLFSPNGPDKSHERLSCNTSVMWVGERLKNGGMANMSRDGNGPSSPAHPELTKCWNDTIPHVQKIEPHLNDFASAISGSWAKKSSVSSTEALAPVQKFADGCLDALKSIAAGFLHGIQYLLEQISKYGNEKIQIPVISGLYKSLVHHDLTVFDAISLIIGIVANTITTIITGSPPPIIAGLKETAFSGLRESDRHESASITDDKFVDFLANLLGLEATKKLDPKDLHAFKTIMSGVMVAKSVFERIIGTLKWLRKVASKGLAETPGIGFEDCFEAVCEALVTVGSFPTPTIPKMPGFEIRELICCLDLIKNVAHIFAACMSSVGESTNAMGVDMFVMLVDTGVAVVTSNLGILAGGLELAAPSWKDYNVEISTAGIVKCVFSAVGSIAYFLVYLDPENVEVSVPCAMVWQGTMAGKMYLQCFTWTLELHKA
ncbi:unnamed protein product [Penicillium glandicola]